MKIDKEVSENLFGLKECVDLESLISELTKYFEVQIFKHDERYTVIIIDIRCEEYVGTDDNLSSALIKAYKDFLECENEN